MPVAPAQLINQLMGEDTADVAHETGFSQTPPGHSDGDAMALLALSHTPTEHRIYEAMLDEATSRGARSCAFSVRRLMSLTGIMSYPTVRLGRVGLVKKLSIESCDSSLDRGSPLFTIYSPREIFERRRGMGQPPYPKEVEGHEESPAYLRAVERVVTEHALSRREAQVALLCAQGLRNKEIAEKLFISAATAKYHLRNIYAKFKVESRSALIAYLFTGANEKK